MVHAAGRNEAAAQAVPSSASASAPSFELAEATIADLQASMQSGARTAVSIAQAYLARIDAVDRQGPAINAVIELNPDALAIAEALDRERRDKGPRGPLHGIPVVLKDNIDTADRMRTSAGSLALGESMRCARRVRRRAFARGGLRGARQDQPFRMGEFPQLALDVGLERPGRADAQPVCARSQHERLELGIGGGDGGRSVRGCRRYRNRRLDRQSGVDLRPRRDQAHGRARQPRGHRSHRAQPGFRGPDDAQRDGCRDPARRDDRRGRARCGDRGQPRQGADRLHALSRSGGIEGRAHRRRARFLRHQRPARSRRRGGHRRDEECRRRRGRSREDRAPRQARPTRNWSCCCTSSRRTSTPTWPRSGPAPPCIRCAN